MNSNINSYKTVVELKNIFKSAISLHYIDTKNNLTCENINSDFMKNQIREDFDI